MAQPILLPRSSTAGVVPSSLLDGQLAINTADLKLYTRKSDGTVALAAAPPSHVGASGTAHANATTTTAGFMSAADKVRLDGTQVFYFGATAPTSPAPGDEFWNTSTTVLYKRVTDGTNAAWLDISSTGGGSGWGSATVASTSGVAIDLTGIPVGATRLTVAFSGVSHAGGANVLVQLGTASGVETTGYASGGASGATGVASAASSAGIPLRFNTNGNVFSGLLTLVAIGSNAWVAAGAFGEESGAFGASGGRKTLSGALDRIRVTTSAGNIAFDAGTITVAWG